MMRSIFASCALAVVLSGCTAFHSLPPQGYATVAEEGALRLLLDQNGDPWPVDASGNAILPAGLDKSHAFRLSSRLKRAGIAYDREAVLDHMAAQLTSGGTPRRVVILIRGFNNSYGTFRAEYAAFRAWLGQHGGQYGAQYGAQGVVRFVDVYWDALHRGGGQANYPFGRFVRSRRNAERAGQCGLRDLLRRLPEGTDVTVVTHSLGAGVGLAALAPKPEGRGEQLCGTEPARALPAQLGDVRMVAVAPALGRIHVMDPEGRVRASSLGVLDRFYLAYNPRDPAVTKHGKGIDLPDWLGGDTRLGGSIRYVARFDAKLAKVGLDRAFQTIEFSQPAHGMAEYLKDAPRAGCLMWAGAILPDRPETCNLSK